MVNAGSREISNAMKVRSLLLNRRESNSKVGARDDGEKIALVIEGGAMRGVVSAGMVAALEQLNMLDCFDTIFGSSAGAICGAYFTAGQARYGTTIFYENINNSNFIDLSRLMVGKSAVDLDFLFEQVCKKDKRLNFESFRTSHVPLHILASNVDDERLDRFSNFPTLDSLMGALAASSQIPLFAGRARVYNQKRYLDASLFESIPLQSAINLGFTRMVALLTRPKGVLRDNIAYIERISTIPYLRWNFSDNLANQFERRSGEYKLEIEKIAAYAEKGATAVLPIFPKERSAKVASLEKDRTRLVEGAKSGYLGVYEALGLNEPELTEILMPF